jgi:NADH-dependent peroxiredoxin subunit C
MIDVLRLGDMVPALDIEVYNPKDREFGVVSLEKLRADGQWAILVFYPADFTFVCPTELADLGGHYEEFRKLGAELISVSTDTKFVHLAWHSDEKLLADVKYPMGADASGKLSRMFGVFDEATGLDRRGTFLVNPEGRLVSIEISFDNVGRNADELLRKLKAHVYVAAHPNEACPAKWEQGRKTLTPGARLVGKVGEVLKKGQ